MARIAILVLAAAVFVLAGCNTQRLDYKQGLALLQAQQYGPALEKFESFLEVEPDSNMGLYGKARCLYELQRYDEALPCFEQFLTQTESNRATYNDERKDAAFYRDKCKMELGMEVPQNKDAIPEEKMRY
ncbi:tetratricopeptide repeat protein [bacterium]|nr:tetratricopeptide repeat protein [bacterium]